MRSQISGQFNKPNVAWNDVNRLPGIHTYSTQGHITFGDKKMIKCIWYENYSKGYVITNI